MHYYAAGQDPESQAGRQTAMVDGDWSLDREGYEEEDDSR